MEVIQALVAVLQPERLAWLLAGTGTGLIIGLLPGMGGVTGLSILLPFIFGMDPVSGVALLVGMAAVVQTSDTFPSVLLGVPGSGGSQATVLDGYPLARKGEAARALGAAFFVSMIGGFVGAAALWLVLPVARPIILTARSPELFMLTLLGLSMVAVVSRDSPRTGVLSGALGLILGAVGASPAVPEYRFTFGWLYLFDGIPLPVLALGLFGLPEVLDLLATKQTIARAESLRGSRVMSGVRDALRHKGLIIASATVGTTVGIIPGLGGSVVDWIAYGLAKRFCKNTQNFGTGDIRGVIAPESANNAKEGGTLIPTLLFGIPGGGVTAVLLSGLLILGIEVGPRMVNEDLPVTLSIVWTLVLANFAATTVCLLLAPRISRLTAVPATVWFPFLIVCLVVASYQSSRQWADLLVFIVMGLLGVAMRSVRWPRAPLLIGFVLSGSSERYLHISVSRYGAEWLLFPTVIGIGVFIILVLIGAGAGTGRESKPKPARAGMPRLCFDAFVLLLFLSVAGASVSFQHLARLFPIYVSLGAAGLAAAHLVLEILQGRRLSFVPAPATFPATGRSLCWVVAFAFLFCVAGMPLATLAFVALYMKYENGFRWWVGLASAGVTAAALLAIGALVSLQWPKTPF